MTMSEEPDHSLAELAELHRRGALTDEEFDAAQDVFRRYRTASARGGGPTGPTPVRSPAPAPLATTNTAANVSSLPGDDRPLASAPVDETRGKTWLIVGAIAVVALALSAVALAVVLQRSKNPPPSASVAASSSFPFDQTASPYDPSTSADPPTDSSRFDDSSTSSEPPFATATPTSSAPTTVGIVSLANVASDPRAFQVGQTLDAYFSGINQHNYQQMLSVMDPALVNPSDADQVAKFEQAVSTSTDGNIIIGAINADASAPSGVSVDVTFQSTQDPTLGPDGEACTNWRLTYLLSTSPYTSFRIFKSHGTHSAC